MPTTPTRRKRRLGLLLENLRLNVDKSLWDAAEMLRVSNSTVSRYETGHVRPGWAVLQALLALYGANDAERAEAASLWEDAGEQTTRVVTPTGSPKSFRSFLRAEAEADSERILEPHVIPGLLQTAAYARALNSSAHNFYRATVPEKYVTARMNRQALLYGENPLRVHAVMDEMALHRAVGGPSVMVEQLQSLLSVCERENITVQVVPFTAGAYGSMSGGFTLVGYVTPDEAATVFADHAGGVALIENEDDVCLFANMFAEVRTLALEPDESAKLVRERLGEFE